VNNASTPLSVRNVILSSPFQSKQKTSNLKEQFVPQKNKKRKEALSENNENSQKVRRSKID
jgi:hypothetical protein